MKRYKIGKYIVDAESPVKAMKIVKAIKDSAIKDSNFDTVKNAFNKYGVDIIKVVNRQDGSKAIYFDKKDEDIYNKPEIRNLYRSGKLRYAGSGHFVEVLDSSAINDDIISELPSELDAAKQYAKNANYQAVANICWGIVDKLKRMKLADADNSDIDKLSDEERKAIEDYKEAIAKTKDVKLLKLFAHILKEETEHLEELQNRNVEE